MAIDPDQVSGTIIKGEDGAVYFLTDEELANAQLPAENGKALLKLYEQGNTKTARFSHSHLRPVAHLEGSAVDTDVIGRF